ncbi:MAG: phage tail protein [Novosphingobium sp.]|nr:phage tail protein [Novosphingobium sp.]
MRMLALDMFVFQIGTMPFQELRQRFDWRFADSDRFRVRQATQFVGVGAETVELAGVLYPGDGIGAYGSIETLKSMANAGESYELTLGTGEVMGNFTIRGLDLTKSVFFEDGAPRKADFTLMLMRVDD